MRYSIISKIIATLLICIMCVYMTPEVYALHPEDGNDYSQEIVPGYEKTERWSYTSSTSAALTIAQNGYSFATTSVVGYQGTTTKIIVYSYLQKYNGSSWTNVSSFSNTVNDWVCAIEQGFGTYATWGHDYRVYNSIYVYAGNAYEHISAYSKIHHYHQTSDKSHCVN